MSFVRIHPRTVRLSAALLAALVATACQQRMADQPYYRTYDESEFFADHRSARPLEEGVFHRGQRLTSDPMVTGLTAQGREPQSVSILDEKGGPVQTKTGAGIPNKVDNFVTAFPFEMTADDLKRGKERFTIYCVPCHGPLGNGRGKIVERAYLEPTSFHTHAVSVDEAEYRKKKTDPGQAPIGQSRGFAFYKIQVPLRDVPVGYFFEVITKGYGGMPDYASQIPPEDRWRIIAYVRALQLSQGADPKKLPDNVRAETEKTGGQK